ncbi:MAG: FkbM family methyltransferase [Candidatus Saccharibacteria bacterium]|nr:FkbM family methyltransferase [Rhodoferax sp.]
MNTSMQAELQSLVQRFAEKPTRTLPAGKAVWIFGAGQFGRDLCVALQRTGHDVAGFVETKPSVTQVLDLPLFNWQQWSLNHCAAPLCVGIFNRSMPLDELESLACQNGAIDVYLPWDFSHVVKQELGWRFWLSDPKRILSQLGALSNAMDRLSDDASKRCLLDIAAFRLGLNTPYASFHHTVNQYFNPLTLDALQGQSIRFVDGGAYNGDTYLELCSLTNVQEAYLFEPDAANFAHLVSRIDRSARRVQCLPLGLADRYGILSFNAGNGEGASISESGTAHIAVAALDTVLAGYTVDFIKLDVEGAELQALHGARQLIQRSRPVLALSLYHCPQDLWELPLALATMCEDYRFYIRQHFFNSFESVLYAVPLQR